MSFEEMIHVLSVPAGANFSSEGDNQVVGQNRFVVVNDEGDIERADANARAFGVLTDKPRLGSPGRVAVGGAVPVEAGAAIEAGAAVSSDADGRAVTQTGTNPRIGTALQSAAAAGALIAVKIDIS